MIKQKIIISKKQYILHFKSPGFLSSELEEVGKMDIVKSLLKCNTVSIPSSYISDKLVLLTVSTRHKTWNIGREQQL